MKLKCTRHVKPTNDEQEENNSQKRDITSVITQPIQSEIPSTSGTAKPVKKDNDEEKLREEENSSVTNQHTQSEKAATPTSIKPVIKLITLDKRPSSVKLSIMEPRIHRNADENYKTELKLAKNRIKSLRKDLLNFENEKSKMINILKDLTYGSYERDVYDLVIKIGRNCEFLENAAFIILNLIKHRYDLDESEAE